MIKKDLLQVGKTGSTCEINQHNIPYQQAFKDHTPINGHRKAFDKSPHPFMIKTLS